MQLPPVCNLTDNPFVIAATVRAIVAPFTIAVRYRFQSRVVSIFPSRLEIINVLLRFGNICLGI